MGGTGRGEGGGGVNGWCITMQSVIHHCAHPESIHTHPHRRDWNFLGGGGFCTTQKCKEMCEALLEFPEGWGCMAGGWGV